MNKKAVLGIIGAVGILGFGTIISLADNKNITTIIETQKVESVISDFDFRVIELKDNGILIGDEKGDLQLESTLKRQEMIVLISRLMGKEEEAKKWDVNALTFEDVGKDNWAAPYIAWAKDNNITKGYSEEWFGYNDELTQKQTEIFLLRILGYNGVEIENDSSNIAYKIGLIEESNNNDKIKRGEVALMLYNALYIENNEGEILAEKLKIKTKLTEEEKKLKLNMSVYNVDFLKKVEMDEDWIVIYINSEASTLKEKNEEEYKGFVHSIISAIGYKNMKIVDQINNLEIIAYCNASKRQVLALEVDGIYNYFNMKESF